MVSCVRCYVGCVVVVWCVVCVVVCACSVYGA